jgi:crotonyl-CoA carboxylase/reductase
VAANIYEIGEIPPLGDIPARMYAQVIRPERFGEPEKAFHIEEIDVPEIGPYDALVLVMAAGINYNNVWAARGIPIDVAKVHARKGRRPRRHPLRAVGRRSGIG